MMRTAIVVLLSASVTWMATLWANSYAGAGPGASYKGLFDLPKGQRSAVGSGQDATAFNYGPKAADSGPSLKDYGAGLNRNELGILSQFNKYVKQTGSSLGELTTKHHLASANCLIALSGEPDPTASQASHCLDRAAADFNRTLLSARYPDYVNSRLQDTPNGPH